MVENCQSLFDDVDERFGWGLRKTLQTEPNVVFLGTATVRMAALNDVGAPFYEFFRSLSLAPLPLRECKVLWDAVSGETRTEREIRPLQILTGGDPRLLVIVAGLSRHRSLRQLLQDLVGLIDDHTEYFRSHLDHLGKTERRVYVALIGRLLHHVAELIGCGLATQDLLRVFAKDARKSAAMWPMVTALRLRNDEKVREPAEVLATAQDLAERLDQSIAQVQARRASASAKV